MTRWSVALGLARFAWSVRSFCRDVETLPRALDAVRRRLASRERLLLDVLHGAVFGHRRSPYWTLLRAAGCEAGDVERLLGVDGVEGALETLRRAGVYVTFDELKGPFQPCAAASGSRFARRTSTTRCSRPISRRRRGALAAGPRASSSTSTISGRRVRTGPSTSRPTAGCRGT